MRISSEGFSFRKRIVCYGRMGVRLHLDYRLWEVKEETA